MTERDEKAVWSTAFINKLPDAAFAWIQPGGKKDEDGKTVPRSLRHLPHHTADVKSSTENDSVDLPHLRAALARANQIPQAGRATARAHLQKHAKVLLGGAGKSADPMVRAYMALELESLNEEERSVEFVASTPTQDSYGDIVQQHWDLSHFDLNPVVLFEHNRTAGAQAERIPVAYSKKHFVKAKQLRFTPVFSDAQANPNAERVWQGVVQRVLRASSVGFRPGKIIREEDESGNVSYTVGTKEHPNILKEISIVPLGANHEAVALSNNTDDVSVPEAYERQLMREELASFEDDDTDNRAPQLAARATQAMESDMDPKEIEAELAKATAEVEKLRGELQAKDDELTAKQDAHATELQTANEKAKELEGSLADASAKLTDSENALEAEKERAKNIDDALVKLEVEKYIGTKLAPAERDTAIADRKREGTMAFTERMAARPDLNLTTETTPAEKVHTTTAATKEKAGSKLAEGMRAVEHKA